MLLCLYFLKDKYFCRFEQHFTVYLFGFHDEGCQSLMDGPGKERLFASVASEEVRVLGWPPRATHRPVGDVRVFDLESQCQAAVALQLRALLVALEVAGVALAGEVVGDDGAVVVVTEPHLGRQLGGADPPVLPLVLAADDDPAQVAALALDLHLE